MEWLDRVELPERYEVQHHVANGGMASVWRARDRLLGRAVAIKLLADAYAAEETAVKRFEREARAAARASAHPNVVTIYDFGVAPPHGTPFIVMEHLPGGSVADALRITDGAGIDQRVAIRWLNQAAAALDHAHSLGVVHRDVKPANMLLDGSRRLHLGDFGIARLASEVTITTIGEVLGTAAYLSPEQALGDPATPASDRYSLAVAAYELLVGSRPFDGDEVLARRRTDSATAPAVHASVANPSLPRGVDAVLARGMSAAPGQRWPSASEFADALGLAIRGPAAVQFAEEPSDYAPFVSYRARRRRLPSWAGPVGALAAVAFGAGIATGASGGSSGGPARVVASRSGRHARSARSQTSGTARPRTSTAAATPPPPTTAASAQAPPSDPNALDVSGHDLMLQGNYTGAIATMRRVLAATPSGSLLHAYALFDLGRSLRLAGDPQAAIPVLQQRLRYPNQTGVVATELALAERAAGVVPAGGPAGQLKHGHRGGHGHGDGGAGLLGGGGGGD